MCLIGQSIKQSLQANTWSAGYRAVLHAVAANNQTRNCKVMAVVALLRAFRILGLRRGWVRVPACLRKGLRTKTDVRCSLLPNNTGALLQFVTSTLANGTLSTSLHLRHLKRSPPKTTDL